VVVACTRQQRAATDTASTAPTGTLSTAAETTSELIGTIVSRDPAKGQMTFDHQEIKGMMGAMTMGFDVRRADVNSLPPDGTRVRTIAHEKDGRYWVTDVQRME
jgi:Cu/Ag efflux protein CusF